MNDRIVVFGPHAPNDDALENSRWVAEKHLEQFGERCVAVVDASALRANLEAALVREDVQGIVLSGHGDGGKEVFLLHEQHHDRTPRWQRRFDETSNHGAIYGSDGESAFDSDNAHLGASRWVHALACEIGLSTLPEKALECGVVAFVSYEQRLVPEFTIETLPNAATTILARIVTRTTLNLAAHRLELRVLQWDVRQAAEDLNAWFDTDEGLAWSEGVGVMEQAGLRKFAMQLSTAMQLAVGARCS